MAARTGGSSTGRRRRELRIKALREAVVDGHREAVIKCLSIWTSIQAGTYRAGPDIMDLLATYPTAAETRSKADTVVRAS